MLNSKIKVLKKSTGTQTSHMLKNTIGVTRITNSPKMGVLYTPASNDLPCSSGRFLMDAILFPGTPIRQKNVPKQKTCLGHV